MPAAPMILASEKTAAKMLDLPCADFRRLVDAGSLPKGREIAPGIVRWRVKDLEAIVTGEAMAEPFQW